MPALTARSNGSGPAERNESALFNFCFPKKFEPAHAGCYGMNGFSTGCQAIPCVWAGPDGPFIRRLVNGLPGDLLVP
jgi:hypothetical protein